MMLGTACDAEEAIARLKSGGIARYLKKGPRREFGDDFGKSGARVSGKKARLHERVLPRKVGIEPPSGRFRRRELPNHSN